MSAVYIIIAIIVILLISFIIIYNRLVRMHNGMKKAWAQEDLASTENRGEKMKKKRAPALPDFTTFQQLWDALGS